MKKKISRDNNFDFLRLLFASFVIVSHSFPLTGIRDLEPLRVLTNWQIDFGGLAVKCFFIISGYLIFQSLERSNTISNYLWKRILRLFPALFVMLLFVIALVPFIYEGNIPLLQNQSYLTYLPRQMTLYNLQSDIEGVFTKLPYSAINGSLWTICYEFSMYLLVGSLFFIKKTWRLPTLIFLFLIFYIIPTFFHSEFLNNLIFKKVYLQSSRFYDLGCYFTAGAILVYFNKYLKNGGGYTLATLSLILIVISLYFQLYQHIAYFALPIVVITFGISSTPIINKVGKTIGDISYGVYIYGWFVQQLLIYFFALDAYQLIIPSLLLSGILGWFSWHLVEKKALNYKNIIK